MKDKILKIGYLLTAFVLVGVVLINSFSVLVMASTEVESLPRTDIDVEVSYSTDNVFLNYDGGTYTLPMSQLLYKKYEGTSRNNWLYKYASDGTPQYSYLKNFGYAPQYTNKHSDGTVAPMSFWFSPSENRVYVLSGFVSDGVSYGKIKSFYDGSFVYDESIGFVAVNYYDLNDMSFNVLGLLRLTGSDASYLGVYPSMCTNGFGLSSWYKDKTNKTCYYPSDLICIYSTYEISGFFEFDGSNVYTPDYYFDNQYLFYVEDIGYTFIDSAESLVDIIARSDGYVYLDFADSCNRRVWTSVDGISWSYSNSVQAMYGDELQISYQWFYDNVGGSMIAKLVYTTDNEYGVEPILPPEFLEEYFSSEVFDVEQIIYLLDYSINYPKGEVPDADKNWFDVLVYATQSFKGDIVSFYRYYQSLQDDSLVKEFTNFIEQQTILKSFTEDYVFEYIFHDDGTYTPVHKVSLYGFVKLMNKSLINIDADLNNIQLNLHNDLKSVFDNISLTNSYMKSIDLAISDLPDYTKQFNESIGIQKDILAALEEMEGSSGSNPSNPSVSNPSVSNPSVSTNFDMVVFENWMNELDKSIDTIAKVEVFDEITDSTDIVGDVVDNAFDEVFDFEKAPELSKGADEVSGMISGAIGQLATGSILIGAFDYASNITSGVGFINANVNNFYEASSVMKPVFLSGAAMFVVNLVLRRKE